MSAWRMRQLRAASGSTGRSCIEPSASSWKVISTRSSTRSRAPAPRESCRARKKRCLWRRRARVHPKGAPRRTIELLAGEMVRLTDHDDLRSEEHTSELQSLMRNSYAVFFLKKKKIVT